MIDIRNDFYTGKRVLVTGATGLVGSWLVKGLLEKGAEVACTVRDEVPSSIFFTEKLNEKASIVQARLEELSDIERAINEYESEIVFHLGAQTIVGTANRSPIGTFESNIRGTWNVLEACRLHDKTVKSVVVASSDKAYGDQAVLPYTESTPLQGKNPYDASKSCADIIAQSYGKTYDLPISISRCGNFFGGGDLNFSRIVPGTIQSALSGVPPIIRSDGKYVRDYIYVKDATQAYELLGQKTYDGKFKGEAFNFSNETQMTVLEMVEKILKLMKKEKLRPKIKNEATNEIRDQHLSSKKAREVLGWKSTWGIDKGLLETIGWYQEYFGKKGRSND